MRKGTARRKPVQKAELSLGGRLTPEDLFCRLDVVFGEAYKSVVEGVDSESVLSDLCGGLADALDLSFIWIGCAGPDNKIKLVATSGSGELEKELLRVPEHMDDSMLGDGPAARALRHQEAQLVPSEDEGFKPWQKAAKKQGVVGSLAVPVSTSEEEPEPTCAVVVADSEFEKLDNPKNQKVIFSSVERIGSVCKGLNKIGQMQIVNQALNSAGNAAIITDTDGTIVWANPSFCRLAGYDVKTVIGRNPRILKSGKQGFRYYDRLWRTISSGKVWNGETVDRDKSGHLYTIRQTVSPVKMGNKISHFISIHDDISDEKAMQQARERARRVDELTGLMTTGLFTERYERAVSTAVTNKEPLALILLTINDFDALMSSLGRDIEELVLETLGDRIRTLLKEGDFAANLSSGDFAVVLNSVNSIEDAQSVADDIQEVLNEPFPLLGDKLYLSRSMGLAFIPDDSSDADELMRIADARAGGKKH